MSRQISNEPVKHFQKLCEKWEKDLQCEVTPEELQRTIVNTKSSTPIVKYQSFQYRLVHRAIPTNIQLKHWRKSETDLCSFCEINRESIPHLLVRCPVVQPVWEAVKEMCTQMTHTPLPVEEIKEHAKTLILNDLEQPSHRSIAMSAKQYIYRQRCLKKRISKTEFKSIVHTNINAEKYYAQLNGKIPQFVKRWKCNVE